jgi:hypothetical protein
VSKARSYRGRWFDETFRKNGGDDARPERLWEKSRAEETCKMRRKPAPLRRKEADHSDSPLLYGLTTLQREANSGSR